MDDEQTIWTGNLRTQSPDLAELPRQGARGIAAHIGVQQEPLGLF